MARAGRRSSHPPGPAAHSVASRQAKRGEEVLPGGQGPPASPRWSSTIGPSASSHQTSTTTPWRPGMPTPICRRLSTPPPSCAACWAGMRAGELLGLAWGQVNLRTRRIVLDPGIPRALSLRESDEACMAEPASRHEGKGSFPVGNPCGRPGEDLLTLSEVFRQAYRGLGNEQGRQPTSSALDTG